MTIKLTTQEWKELHSLLGDPSSGKIAAIKHVRQASLHLVETDTGGVASGIGLREAKDAVEDYMHRMGMAEQRSTAPYAVIIPHQPIRRIVCDFGEGELELDLDVLTFDVCGTCLKSWCTRPSCG